MRCGATSLAAISGLADVFGSRVAGELLTQLGSEIGLTRDFHRVREDAFDCESQCPRVSPGEIY